MANIPNIPLRICPFTVRIIFREVLENIICIADPLTRALTSFTYSCALFELNEPRML